MDKNIIGKSSQTWMLSYFWYSCHFCPYVFVTLTANLSCNVNPKYTLQHKCIVDIERMNQAYYHHFFIKKKEKQVIWDEYVCICRKGKMRNNFQKVNFYLLPILVKFACILVYHFFFSQFRESFLAIVVKVSYDECWIGCTSNIECVWCKWHRSSYA